jgi:hypothetical protein
MRIAGIHRDSCRKVATHRHDMFALDLADRAADAGSALVCLEFRHVMGGGEAVDSFSMNARKWPLANNDCCAMRARAPSLLAAAAGTEQEYILMDAAAEGTSSSEKRE